jgi:hypothetical protein
MSVLDLRKEYSNLKLPQVDKSDYSKLLFETIEGEKNSEDWTTENILIFLERCIKKGTHLDFSLFTLVVNSLYSKGVDLGSVIDDEFLLFTKKGK